MNETTTYLVIVSQNGCEATDEVTVIVNPYPIANAGDDISMCEGETRMLTATGGDSYVWSTGETSQKYNN